MTNEQHNKFIGIAFLVHGGFQMLMALLMALMFGSFALMIPNQPGREGPPRLFFLAIMVFVVVIQSIFATPSFVAGYAVLKRKSWARLSSIIAAVFSAMNVPIGTAVCVYALWFFFGENWKEIYQTTPGGARAELPNDATAWANQPWEARRGERVPPTPPDWR
ncbi:MAG: hypothetical protein QOE33_289 [Acidobacteriota bacterium]|nr:hypothetical protein [Acidobacteriota bacterium]